jgi:hypothetical protein
LETPARQQYSSRAIVQQQQRDNEAEPKQREYSSGAASLTAQEVSDEEWERIPLPERLRRALMKLDDRER